VWSLALKNMLKERVRLLVSIGGVALAVTLIVLLRGLFVAYETKVSDYFGRTGADLWVVQQGTADFLHSFSLVPDEARSEIAALDGIEKVRPYLARQVGFELDGEETLLYLAGFDPADPVTGPVRMEEGTLQVGSDGIVVDRVFASQQGVEIGDRLVLNDTSLRVDGISSGGDMMMYQYAYVRDDVARTVLDMPAHNNAALIEISPGADPGAVADRIQGISGELDVRTTDKVIADNQKVITDGFLPVIAVLLAIGFLVGVAVIGLTIYSAVLEKRREYGMLKAVGAKGRQMTTVVAAQALLAAAGGYLVGLGLAAHMGRFVGARVPQFATDIVASDLAWIALAAVVMAVVASLIPLSRIARIDPAEVFRS
jgi:putative ABC transport system permease protein